MSKWYNMNEAAEELGVNRKTVWEWIQNYLDHEHGEVIFGPCLPGGSAAGSTLLFVKDEDLKQFKLDHKYEIADKQDAIEQHRGYAPRDRSSLR